jgi:hypothetical protein
MGCNGKRGLASTLASGEGARYMGPQPLVKCTYSEQYAVFYSHPWPVICVKQASASAFAPLAASAMSGMQGSRRGGV